MKKVLAFALTVCMLLSFAIVSNAYVDTTTFEDNGESSALGLSVNNRETAGVDSSSIYYFRQDMTNSHNLDTGRTTNYIVEETAGGNKCVKFDAYEAWISDESQGSAVVSIDLKPTTVTGLAGVVVFGDPYNGITADSVAQSEGYLANAVGMTIDADCESVVVFFGADTTFKFNTGVDLKADWHTYAAYTEANKVTFTIDDKIVATMESADGTVKIYDNAGTEKASVEGAFYTADPRCGFVVTGTGMDILGDNLVWATYEAIPTAIFEVEEDAPQTGDNSVVMFAAVAVIALAAVVVLKKRVNA